MRKYLYFGLALTFIIGGIVYWIWGPASASGVTFRTEAITKGELLATVGGTGTLEPEVVIDVGTQVAGLIKAFGIGTDGKVIDYGSPVEPGTILARIDDSLYAAKADQSRALLGSAQQKVLQAKAKVDEAMANTNTSRAILKQAQARANQSKRDWDRAKSIKASGSISDQEYDAAQSLFEVNNAGVVVSEANIAQSVASEADVRASVGDAQAAVATAKAVLHQDEINLGYCVIKSDVAGTIIDRRVTIGQTVQSSFNTPSLFLIAKDMKRMKVWASVNESDIGHIRVGQPVTFGVDAYPKTICKGVVVRIRLNATNTQNVVVYTVEVSADNPDGLLLPYMTANLKFEVARHANSLLIPNAALRYRPTGTSISNASGKGKEDSNSAVVYVVEAGKLRAVPIKTGLTDGNMTEVLNEELSSGSEVVVGETRSGEVAKSTENPFATKMVGGKKN